jgi:hypothetical protein
VVEGADGRRVLGVVKRADVSSTYLRYLQGAPAPPAGQPAAPITGR